MSMFRKLKKRTKNDEGNAVIMLGLMLIMALLIVGGLLLDVSKAYQIKSSYIDAARKATQAAVMEQSTTGHLKVEAAGAVVRIYEHITRPSVINTDEKGYFSRCVDYDESDVTLEIYMGKDDGSGKKDVSEKVGEIKRNQVGENDSDAQIVNKISWVGPIKNDIPSKKYTSIELVVTEGTQNVILPSAFKIAGNKGEKNFDSCQKMTIGAKANIFTEMSEGGN